MNISARNGKIARLPDSLRTELNERLLKGESGARLVLWLNSLPVVRQLVAAEFSGVPISEQNISEWRNGGFLDWRTAQAVACKAAERAAEAASLVDSGVTTDHLLKHLVARYAVALNHWDGSPEGTGAAVLAALKPVTREILAIRRSEHVARRLELESEKLEFQKSSARQTSDPVASTSTRHTPPAASASVNPASYPPAPESVCDASAPAAPSDAPANDAPRSSKRPAPPSPVVEAILNLPSKGPAIDLNGSIFCRSDLHLAGSAHAPLGASIKAAAHCFISGNDLERV